MTCAFRQCQGIAQSQKGWSLGTRDTAFRGVLVLLPPTSADGFLYSRTAFSSQGHMTNMHACDAQWPENVAATQHLPG